MRNLYLIASVERNGVLRSSRRLRRMRRLGYSHTVVENHGGRSSPMHKHTILRRYSHAHHDHSEQRKHVKTGVKNSSKKHDEEPNCATVEGRLTIRKGRPEGTNRGVLSTLGPARRRFRPIVFTLPTETFYYLQLTSKPTIFQI